MKMPVLFIGHGSPMNALEDNPWSQAFKKLGAALPKPKAIICVSAHWWSPGTFVTGNEEPETIHDFGGFPQPLFEVQYPAKGDPRLAENLALLLPHTSVRLDWGLDHGAWSVLTHLRPQADVPVLQLSLDQRATADEHLALGARLAGLREEGVLILGSGNLTHNLRHAFSSWRQGITETPPWATRFDADAQTRLEQHDGPGLAKLLATDDGRMCHPTLEHFMPVLYALGASDRRDTVTFPITGFAMSSLSMRAVQFG